MEEVSREFEPKSLIPLESMSEYAVHLLRSEKSFSEVQWAAYRT